MNLRPFLLLAAALTSLSIAGLAQQTREPREYVPAPFDAYFRSRAAAIAAADWRAGLTRENWPAKRDALRLELRSMLGLNPWPERGELKPVITGKEEGDGYKVEKLQFQSSPGLYVTGNLYLPKELKGPAPTVLYVCGHSLVEENGVRMGNKTGYQHHGSWYARHGFVCLIIDTIQLGEIRGEHHGTYKLGRWQWPAMGYTPAGVEAWNGIRALDYLETRPEVDRARIGVTGRSGGGAYSWWIAALDERIKAAAPTAGITTMHNHVIDGAIEGHCDCMFMVNSSRWDFDRVAALVAPRALLIANTDKDAIFPLDGVVEIYTKTRSLYTLLGAEAKLGLHIAEGPHKDSQPLNTGEFHWMERFLKDADLMALTDEPAKKMHKPADLKVFAEIPKDERVTTVDEWFVPRFGEAKKPASKLEWETQRDSWMAFLRKDVFGAWPQPIPQGRLRVKQTLEATGLRLSECEVQSESDLALPLWVLHGSAVRPEELELVVLNALDDEGWSEFRSMAAAGFPTAFPGAAPSQSQFEEERKMLTGRKWAMAYLCPRAIGNADVARMSESKRTHFLRRFQLLGETLASGQVWDIAAAAGAIRAFPGLEKTPLWMQAQKEMAVNTAYAALFTPNVTRLDLHSPASSHWGGPAYLNVLRKLDVPQAVAMAAERSTVAIYTDRESAWKYPADVTAALELGPKRFQLRKPVSE